MKLGNFPILLPLYQIESNVTYHTERKPTVFERMVLRLCDPGAHFSGKENLSLLSVFRDQLGAGDVRELLEKCLSELVALGALPRFFGRDSLNAPLTELALTAEGVQFLRCDRLPVRSRMVKVWHRYDPISDEIKATKSDGDRVNQSRMNHHISAAERVLMPQNPLPQVERALMLEDYDWKNPATVIDLIVPRVQSTEWVGRKLEVSCSEDAVLSVRAIQDASFQRWLEQVEPELVWEIMLADTLTSDSNVLLQDIDSTVLQDTRAARPIMSTDVDSAKARFCIIAQDAVATDALTPTIVLSSEVNVPALVSDSKESTMFTLHVPTPKGIIKGFSRLFLPQASGVKLQLEVAGNFRLYWAGQPRICGLTVTLQDQPTTKLWETLRPHLESACEDAEDPFIAMMPLAWKDTDATIREIIWPWLAVRAEQSLEKLLALIKKVRQAVNIWSPYKEHWKAVLEGSLAIAVDVSLKNTPKNLELEKIISFMSQIAEMLPVDKALPRQSALLSHSVPIRLIEHLTILRKALPIQIEIPEALLDIELRQTWLDQVLKRKELKLHGPHALQLSLQKIAKAVQDVYRDIGEQALIAAKNGQMDARTLTPHALDAVRSWRETVQDFHSLKASSPLWDLLNKMVESWSTLAQEMLAPVEIGFRIVVLDTSALMENIELLKELHSNDILVVPYRVLSELDGLKTSEDETRAFKARTASRQLEEASSRIRHIAEHTALLPAEWDPKQPDHAILSTALFFRLNEVLFVSNDINLRNKAQALGLTARDTKLFAAKRSVATSQNVSSRKQDKRKKQRK